MSRFCKFYSVIGISLLLMSCGGGGSSKSSNADLSGLTISVADLDQSFSEARLDYTSDVDNSGSETSVTATLDDDKASLSINGVATVSGQASAAISLAAGDNSIGVVVTAEDGSTQKTYTLTVNRESLFSSRTPKYTHFIADRETDEMFELYAVLDDGSESPIKLSGTLVAEGDVTNFAVSFDGSYVAYLANQVDEDVSELYVLPVSDANPDYKVSDAEIVSGTRVATSDVRSFSWSPTESKLVFLADREDDEADKLYMVDADGNNLLKINGPTGASVEIGDYAWSSDGSYVAYKVYNRDLPDEVIGVNSHEVGTSSIADPGFSVRLNQALVAGGSVKSFQWLSGTDTVAYLADQDTLDQDELYIATAGVDSAATKKNHTLDSGKNVTDYGGVGSYLAYIAEGATESALYASLQSGGAGSGVPISGAHDVLSFAASGDGALVAYTADTGSANELFASSPDGSVVARPMSASLVANGSVTHYAWAPDSSRLAYIADQEIRDVYELYTSLADGSDLGQKASAEPQASGDVLAFAWSSDSSRLAYSSDDESLGEIQLYTSALDGSWTGNKLSSATALNSSDSGLISFEWAEDGAAVIYQATETSAGVIDIYSGLADGGIKGSRLSGTLVSNGGLAVQGSVTDLFTDGSWLTPHSYSEMCGVAYDANEDAMYINKCDGGGRSNKILRYSFSNNTIRKVYEISDQLQYGMRIFDDNLWLANTYGESVIRLGDLDQAALTEVIDYFGGVYNEDLNEIADIAISEDDLYFVTGNFLTSDNHQGIQKIASPNFDNVSEFVSVVDSGWTSSQTRSLVAVGSGANAHLVVASGSGQDLERWDLDGNFVNLASGFGGAYLQVDSSDNIYTVSASGTNSRVTQWASDLSGQEETIFASENFYGDYVRFILKECSDCVEIIYTQFRSRDPQFEITSVPK